MSSVHQVDGPYALREHRNRLRALEDSGALFIFVGSYGLDGVDDLLTPDSPPFQNGWTNSLGDEPPVAFTIVNGWVHILGGYVGGGDGTVIFTLPIGYRPLARARHVGGTGLANHYSTYYIEPNGDVVFGTVV
jgi:hypothetical protein